MVVGEDQGKMMGKVAGMGDADDMGNDSDVIGQNGH